MCKEYYGERCSRCGQYYIHHQHPCKPPGVIAGSTCGCVIRIKQEGSTTVIELISPEEK